MELYVVLKVDGPVIGFSPLQTYRPWFRIFLKTQLNQPPFRHFCSRGVGARVTVAKSLMLGFGSRNRLFSPAPMGTYI